MQLTQRARRAAMAAVHLSSLRQIWSRLRPIRRPRRSPGRRILNRRQRSPDPNPMNTNRPEPNLELHQPEPFRVAFALFALVLGAIAALQI